MWLLAWLKSAWDAVAGLFVKRETLRDADDARVRLNVDFVLAKMRERITEQGERIAALESEQRAQSMEMMRINIERAECRAETAALKREIEALKARG